MSDLRTPILVFAAALLLAPMPEPALGQEGAQQTEPSPAPAGEQEPAIEGPQDLAPIQPTDIQAEAEATVRRLGDVDAGIAEGARLESFRQSLDGLRTQFQTLEDRYGSVDERTILASRIENALAGWAVFEGQVSPPLEAISARYLETQEQLDELAAERARWEATLDALTADEDLPADVAADLGGRVTDTLSGIAETRSRLQQRSDEVLTLQNDLAALGADVAQRISYLELLAANVRRRVLARDAAPIWNLGSGEVAALGSEARDALGDRLRISRQFFADRPEQTAALFVTFLLFVAVGFVMRRRSRRWGDVAGTEALYEMLERPVSLAMIFTLLSASWFYSSMPTTVVDLFLLVTLVPVLRLAPGLLEAEDRPTLYGLLAVYAAMRLTAPMAQGTALRRLSLLLLTTAALVGLVRFARRRLKAMTAARGASWRAAGVIARLAIPLLVAGVAANLLGWVRLAWVIISGSILSAYAAVILWLFVGGASGVAAVLPLSRVGNALPSIRRKGPAVTRVLVTIVRLAAIWIWVDATLSWFLLRAPVEDQLRRFFQVDLGVGGFQITVGDVVAAVLVLIVTPLISRLVRFFFLEEVRPRLALPTGSADGINSLIHYTIITIGILVAATAAGFNATQLTVVAGALGVGIGFGLQNIVGNFISGLILIFERPISVGDRISAGNTQQVGVVTRIGIRASTVRTFDGSEVVVPNSDLISKEVVNWTLSDMQRRLEMKVNIEYGADPRRVIELLGTVADEHPDVLSEPSPVAVFDGFGDSWLAFRLLYWVPMEDLLRIKTEMSLGVDDALRGAGIEVAVPRRRLEIESDSGERRDGDALDQS